MMGAETWDEVNRRIEGCLEDQDMRGAENGILRLEKELTGQSGSVGRRQFCEERGMSILNGVFMTPPSKEAVRAALAIADLLTSGEECKGRIKLCDDTSMPEGLLGAVHVAAEKDWGEDIIGKGLTLFERIISEPSSYGRMTANQGFPLAVAKMLGAEGKIPVQLTGARVVSIVMAQHPPEVHKFNCFNNLAVSGSLEGLRIAIRCRKGKSVRLAALHSLGLLLGLHQKLMGTKGAPETDARRRAAVVRTPGLLRIVVAQVSQKPHAARALAALCLSHLITPLVSYGAAEVDEEGTEQRIDDIRKEVGNAMASESNFPDKIGLALLDSIGEQGMVGWSEEEALADVREMAKEASREILLREGGSKDASTDAFQRYLVSTAVGLTRLAEPRRICGKSGPLLKGLKRVMASDLPSSNVRELARQALEPLGAL